MPEVTIPTEELKRRLSRVSELLKADIDQQVFAGACVTALDTQGRPHFVEAGTFDYGSDVPFTRTSLVDIASITKLLTSLAFHRLQQSETIPNLFDLPVQHLLPFQPLNSTETITIADLLSMHVRWHTGDSLSTITHNILSQTQDNAERQALLRSQIMNSPLERLEGTDHQYQDATYIALAWILEELSRQQGHPTSYDAIVIDSVLRPLGMHDTTTTPDRARCVPSGMRNGVPIQGETHDPKALFMHGHAGFFSTAVDLARLAAMIQGDGTLPGETTPFLTPGSYVSLTERQTLDPARGWWGRGIRRFTEGGPHYNNWYGQHADNDTLSITGFTGQQIVCYRPRTAVVLLTNFHLAPLSERTATSGDRSFDVLKGPRLEILETLSNPTAS